MYFRAIILKQLNPLSPDLIHTMNLRYPGLGINLGQRSYG